MKKPKPTTFTKRYDEVITLIKEWQAEGASTEEILGVISTIKESVKYSFAIYIRDAIERQKEQS